MKSKSVLIIAVLLGGCQTGYWHDYKTGQRADETQELLERLGRARVICNGEVAKVPNASPVGGDRIFNACMIGQGFEIRMPQPTRR